MARLVGVDLPRAKRIEVALTYIYGIGRTRSHEILAATEINEDIRVKALTDDQLEGFVGALDGATRVLVAANGLSAPLGLDMVLRLTAAGRPAEYLPDTLGQEIAARQLGAPVMGLALAIDDLLGSKDRQGAGHCQSQPKQ